MVRVWLGWEALRLGLVLLMVLLLDEFWPHVCTCWMSIGRCGPLE